MTARLGRARRAAVQCGLCLLVAVAVVVAIPAVASAARRSVVLVFVPPTEYRTVVPGRPTLLSQFQRRASLSLGLIGATQGHYAPAQALLDITQGTRVSFSTYQPTDVPQLTLTVTGGSGRVHGWGAVLARAAHAPAQALPGLLAGSVPAGAAYVSTRAANQREFIAAADRSGRVSAVSLGSARTLTDRVAAAMRHQRLVVASLPRRPIGLQILDALIAARRRSQLLLIVQTPPDGRALQLLRAALDDGGPAGTLTSQTTRRRGIVAGIDLLPTVLAYLGIRRPSQVRGEPIAVLTGRDRAGLEDLAQRLGVVGPRRIPALMSWLLAWLTVALALGLIRGPTGLRDARRLGGLALLWIPSVVLLCAALRPGRVGELALVAAATFLLAAITDRTLAWPLGPLAPIAAAAIGYTADLVNHSELIVQSLLGPNPRSGSRFYGVGNELEAALSVLILVGIGAALGRSRRSRRAAAAFAVGGTVFAAVLGSGRLGADVGGVITLGAGTAAATVLMLPKRPSRPVLALFALTPLLAVAALALLDLATHGNGHFTRSVLHADGPGAVLTIAARRYELAFSGLIAGVMPLLALVGLLAVAYALRYRALLYAPIAGHPGWQAGIGGALAATLTGALSNDSGPLLLIIGVFTLACVSAYLTSHPGNLMPPPPVTTTWRADRGRPATSRAPDVAVGELPATLRVC